MTTMTAPAGSAEKTATPRAVGAVDADETARAGKTIGAGETGETSGACETAGEGETAEAPLLQIEHLGVSFVQYAQGLRRRNLQVISNLSITVRPRQMVAVVGSSGSGKSLLAHAILGILPSNATTTGEIRYKGERLTDERVRALRGRQIAFIPQSVECLDPLMRAGAQVRGVGGDAGRARQVMRGYGLDQDVDRMFPFQLSGGMARRVLLSTAAMSDAELIVADEPTPGLTHELAVEALGMLRDFADAGKGVLVITHDLDLAYEVADMIVVFYAGTTLEAAPAEDFRNGPDGLRHPYSKALWRALPQNGFQPIEGTQPYTGTIGKGCVFGPRCPMRDEECACDDVPMRSLRGGEVRCIHAS